MPESWFHEGLDDAGEDRLSMFQKIKLCKLHEFVEEVMPKGQRVIAETMGWEDYISRLSRRRASKLIDLAVKRQEEVLKRQEGGT